MAIDQSNPLLESLSQIETYPHKVSSDVKIIETHISWVVLAGEYAYKIKKPIRNSFVDYSTLPLRLHYCEEELRLNQRFAKDIYLDVVPITSSNDGVRVGGSGEPVEYAVRMKRFASDALLSYRVSHDLVHVNEVRALAATIAEFHTQAAIADPQSHFGTLDLICSEAIENCRDINNSQIARTFEAVELLNHWTLQYFSQHQNLFLQRRENGRIRECHGDLHLGNVVCWKEELIPFDGIEFCDDFRWIDTLSDAAFTAMDFAAYGRMDFCNSFVNAYVESTGDYSALALLKWYSVYRALVRAKVAALRSTQTSRPTPEHATAERELDAMLDLASRFTKLHCSKPQLWITYGLSGSGKTTGTEQVLQRHAAIRIRSDVERKRLPGLQPHNRAVSGDPTAATLYSSEMTTATYQRMAELAEHLLCSNVHVIIDATCLLKWQREIFKDLAQRLNVPLRILAFHADDCTLRQRILQRRSEHRDASDADLEVLEMQLKMQQHLDVEELQYVAAITD